MNASRGHRHWLMQRISAMVMATYSPLLLIVLLNKPVSTYAAWKALFALQWFKIATLLFLISLFVHAWMGISDVLNDYIPSPKIQLILQKMMEASLLGYTVWSIYILWNA